MALLNLCLYSSQLTGQNYSPSSTHKTETSSSTPAFAANKCSIFLVCHGVVLLSGSYITLKQSERKKPKLESQHFPTSSSSSMQPCSKQAQHTAQETSGSYYSRTKPKEKTIELPSSILQTV